MPAIYIPTSTVAMDSCQYIDIKCFDQAWVEDTWKIQFAHCDVWCLSSTGYTEPVGFIACKQLKDEQYGSIYVISKIAVLPNYRRLGYGAALVRHVCSYADSRGFSRIHTYTPESMINPGAEGDVSSFLRHMGFKARYTDQTMLWEEQIQSVVEWTHIWREV